MKYDFNSGWKVFVGDPNGAEAPHFEDANWKNVTAPHAWNEDDALKKDIKEPEGNYNVAITFGDQEAETTTTVKAGSEPSRQMMARITTTMAVTNLLDASWRVSNLISSAW